MISDKLTEIASYSFPHEAHVAKASLEAAGIPVFLTDEYTINVQWLYSNALGGVRLLVLDEHGDAAREILAADFSAAIEDEDWAVSATVRHEADNTLACSACGSDKLVPYTSGKKPAVLIWLLLGAPLFFLKMGMRCEACGNFQSE